LIVADNDDDDVHELSSENEDENEIEDEEEEEGMYAYSFLKIFPYDLCLPPITTPCHGWWLGSYLSIRSPASFK
jgi:hypothetical protein